MGTSFAEMTRSDNSNGKKGPSKDFNAFNDFHESETVASILAAWMEFAGIESITLKVSSPTQIMYSIFFHSFFKTKIV